MATAGLIAFLELQATPVRYTGEGVNGAFSIPPPPDEHAVIVKTAEEASKLLDSTPIRLPINIPASMRYIKILVLDGVAAYVFCSEEPMAEADNPFIPMYMQFGWWFANITGAPPEITVLIGKLDPESATMAASLLASEESARKYADEYNLTMRIVDSVLVFGYDPVKNRVFVQPIDVVHFYKGDLAYQIRAHLSFEKMVKIARSIIEQF